MQDLDQQQPRQPVVRGHGDEVVDRCDQRAGGHGGVDAEALEEDGHGRADDAREQHGHQQRRAGAKRHREGKGRLREEAGDAEKFQSGLIQKRIERTPPLIVMVSGAFCTY